MYDVVVIPDLHIPFEDKRAVDQVLDHVWKVRPAQVILLGDVVDFTGISRFLTDPTKTVSIGVELAGATKLLSAFPPDVKVTYIMGNHEERLQKYILRNAPALAALTGNDGPLTLPALLHVKNAIEYVEFGGAVQLTQDFIIEHGDRASKHSAYTAKAMFDTRLVSGLSGHTHRMGSFYYSGFNKEFEWHECGYLGDPTSPAFAYASNKNWQQGFAYLTVDEEKVWVSMHRITDKKFFWNGRIIK